MSITYGDEESKPKHCINKIILSIMYVWIDIQGVVT